MISLVAQETCESIMLLDMSMFHTSPLHLQTPSSVSKLVLSWYLVLGPLHIYRWSDHWISVSAIKVILRTVNFKSQFENVDSMPTIVCYQERVVQTMNLAIEYCCCNRRFTSHILSRCREYRHYVIEVASDIIQKVIASKCQSVRTAAK